jgi:hypothetical protein
MLQQQNPVMIGMASVPTAPLFLHCKVKLTGCETSKAGLETICIEQATRLPNANWAPFTSEDTIQTGVGQNLHWQTYAQHPSWVFCGCPKFVSTKKWFG